MRTKIVDGVCYEYVVTAKKDYLECTAGVWKQLRTALEEECYFAQSTKDEMRKRMFYTRFMLEHFGYFMAASLCLLSIILYIWAFVSNRKLKIQIKYYD